MLALALNPQQDKNYRNHKSQRTVNRPLTVHERFILKAEAIFPGSEIVSEQKKQK